MTHYRISAVVGLMCCVSVGCSSPTSPVDEQALGRAEARWAARAFDSYAYEIVSICGECAPSVARSTRVEVRDGKVTAARVVANDSLLPTVASYTTVDGLFAQIRSYARGSLVKEVRVTYDPRLGYPTSIDVFAKEGVADGDFGKRISNLVSAP